MTQPTQAATWPETSGKMAELIRAHDWFASALATRQAPNVRWHMRKDGSRVFIEGVVRPMAGSDGGPTGFLMVGQDVTQWRAAAERLQLATEAARIGIFDVDLADRQACGRVECAFQVRRARVEAEEGDCSMIRRIVTRRDVARIFVFGGILLGLGLVGFRSDEETRSEMDTSMGEGSSGLSPELIEAIKLRIQDPRRRSTVRPGEPVAVVTEPGQLEELFASQGPEAVAALRAVNGQREQWGQQMPPMYVTRNDDGTLAALSEDPNNYPLAPPATEAGFDLIERSIGRALPRDLRQLYLIADGGFGPGLGYTPGFGPGIYSLERIGQELDDLRRRGPDYTGRTAWPSHLLPLTDNFGPVSYDLERGVIVAFNEYYEDEGLTVDTAFSDLHPSLENWLADWLRTTP